MSDVQLNVKHIKALSKQLEGLSYLEKIILQIELFGYNVEIKPLNEIFTDVTISDDSKITYFSDKLLVTEIQSYLTEKFMHLFVLYQSNPKYKTS